MLRAFSASLVVFSILSLVVHLNARDGDVFGMAALSLFAIDERVVKFAKTPRRSRGDKSLCGGSEITAIFCLSDTVCTSGATGRSGCGRA